MKALPLVYFIFFFGPTVFAKCPKAKRCVLSGYQYTRMCDCSANSPTHCVLPASNCTACVLQGQTCAVTEFASRCCPSSNGQTYCNVKTNKCEIVRYCNEDGSNCPFDDLNVAEITETVNIIKASKAFLGPYQFSIFHTSEPPKAEWNTGTYGSKRIAHVGVYDLTTNVLNRVLVDLGSKSVISRTPFPNLLFTKTSNEQQVAEDIFFNDLRVQAAYRRRDLDPQYAGCAGSVLGATGPIEGTQGRRVVRCVAYYADRSTKYMHWRPVTGLQVTIDTANRIITDFQDTEAKPLAPAPQILKKVRNPKLKKIKIVENGSSIRVRGQQIQWYKWKFMYSMDTVHGLQLFHVRYNGDCEDRLVLYKASISEMLVPYGAQGKQWRWRRPFDVGNYGLGLLTVPQILGQDVPENTVFINCTQYDDKSGIPMPRILPNCIAAYERDIGMLYKHTDTTTGARDGRRGRQMVLNFVATIGNYDYVYEYIFNMDGVLDFNVKLTGIMQPQGVAITKNDYSCIENCINLSNDYLLGPIHQHFFNYRLDFDIDGLLNHVLETDVTRDPPGLHNPDGGAFSAKNKLIRIEFGRDDDVKKSRSWHVINANSRNKFNSPRGFALKPNLRIRSLDPPGSPYLPQSEFLWHAFWATAYKDEEQEAAGHFPRSGTPGQGMPNYIKDGESLENADSVVWYTFGTTHNTRPEEFPLMNIQNAGFSIVPYNFMSQNSEVSVKGSC